MFGNNRNNSSTASSSDFDVHNMTWSSLIAWISAVGLILLGILAFVHFTLYPIFQFQPGGKGIIPVPGNKNYYTQWPPQTSATLATPQVDLSGALLGMPQPSNWAFTLDISIMCPLNPITIRDSTPGYRLLFTRGGVAPTTLTESTLDGIWSQYNVAVALLPTTNDLAISVLSDSGSNGETVILYNVPVQTPFRLGVIMLANAFEVYLNGKLIETKLLNGAVNKYDGKFMAVGGQFSIAGNSTQSGTLMKQIARVGNLIVWPLVPTPSELRYATPTLMPALPEDSECGAINPISCVATTPTDTSILAADIAMVGQNAMAARQAYDDAAAAQAAAKTASDTASTYWQAAQAFPH